MERKRQKAELLTLKSQQKAELGQYMKEQRQRRRWQLKVLHRNAGA